MLWHALSLALVLLLLWSTPGPAQIPVTDAGNLAVNTTTSLQSTITAIEAVLQTANQILELTPVEEIIIAGGIAEDMAMLAEILATAEGLAYDVGSLSAQISALFSLESAPHNTADLALRLSDIRVFVTQSYSFAMRTQTLIMTLLRTVDHVIRLVDQIGTLIGNLSSNQTIVQVESTIAQTLATLTVQTAAFQRAQSVERITEPLIMQSLQHINADIRADWPQ